MNQTLTRNIILTPIDIYIYTCNYYPKSPVFTTKIIDKQPIIYSICISYILDSHPIPGAYHVLH